MSNLTHDLIPTQEKVLRRVHRSGHGHCQLAGHGAAPLMSAARALCRRGLLGSSRTGYYFITDAGIKAIEEITR